MVAVPVINQSRKVGIFWDFSDPSDSITLIGHDFVVKRFKKTLFPWLKSRQVRNFFFHVFQFCYNTREIGNEWWRIQKTRLHSPELSNLLRFWKMRKGEYHVFHSLFLVRYKYETIILVLHCVVTALATNLVMKLHVGLKQTNLYFY